MTSLMLWQFPQAWRARLIDLCRMNISDRLASGFLPHAAADRLKPPIVPDGNQPSMKRLKRLGKPG
jgi:hypothetical protein